MPEVTIDKQTTNKISIGKGEGRVFTDDFLERLKPEGIRHYGYEEGEQETDPHLIVDGQYIEYFFQDDGSLLLFGKGAEKVAAAIRKLTKPSESSSCPPPPRATKKLDGKGRRKTQSKRKTRRRAAALARTKK